MASFNQATILGNSTRDVQVKHLPGGGEVAEWGMACNRRFKTSGGEDREDVLFIDCAAFGKLATICGQFVTKGKQMMVSGRLKMDTWEAKDGGGKRSKISLVVNEMQLLGSRDGGDGDDTDQRPQPRRAVPGQRPQTPRDESPPFGDEPQFKEADIPFLWSGRDTQPV